jgi:capsular exopolysaccharide synthesis family protein
VANAYANAYITYRKTTAVNDLLDAEQLIQGRITDIQHQIDSIDNQISAAPAASQATLQTSLSPQRSALLAQQGALKQQLDQSQLQSALANTGAQLGSSATIPSSPSGPHPFTSGVAALILGLLAGVALAFVVDLFDDSIASHEDAERAAYGLTTLGMTPSVPGWKAKDEAVVVSLTEPASPAAEAYRSLRTALQFAALDGALKVVEVTSPGPSEGKSTTLANLAVAFGRGGAAVCAVDADLRRPRLHAFFGATSEPGLTSVIGGDLPLSRAIQTVAAPGVALLAAGPPPVDPSELLASERTQGVLASLAHQFDMVLVDSPPTLPVTDAAVLARHADGVIIVVDVGRTKKRELTRAVQLLRQVDAPLLGLVVNRADRESRYGFSYDYRYPPAEEAKATTAAPAKGGRKAGQPPEKQPQAAAV